MAKGPDSIAAGDTPSTGTTVFTWLMAMIKEADDVRTKMLQFLPFMTDTFNLTWEMGKEHGVRSNPPLLPYNPPPLPPTRPFVPLPFPSDPTHGIASGVGGGGGKTADGNKTNQTKKPEKPRQVYHCQACGRKDAWHKDGTTCPALLKTLTQIGIKG